MAYYNTNNMQGVELEVKREKSLSQKELIKKYFAYFPDAELTCEDLQKILFIRQDTPITSVRRAVSDLVKEGYLIYTGDKKLGKYGDFIRVVKLR